MNFRAGNQSLADLLREQTLSDAELNALRALRVQVENQLSGH